MLSGMQRSHLRFIVAAATIAAGAVLTFTAPTAFADRISGPTNNSGTASADNGSPVYAEITEAQMAEIVKRMQQAAQATP